MTGLDPLWLWVRDEAIDRDRLREAVLGVGSTEDAVRVLDEFAQHMDSIAQHSTGSALIARLMIAELRGEPVSPADAEGWEHWGNQLSEPGPDTDSE
jgi:hypothetical protein